jgi:hypothetical protein
MHSALHSNKIDQRIGYSLDLMFHFLVYRSFDSIVIDQQLLEVEELYSLAYSMHLVFVTSRLLVFPSSP